MTAPNPDTTTTNTAALDNTIDTLLQRYLVLLDEYTTLRNKLNHLQSGIYQNIARANFSAERGIRYGQDHYDERMQALRRVVIQPAGGIENGSGSFSFEVVNQDSFSPDGSGVVQKKEDAKEGAEEEKEKPASKTPKSTDPLRWFGFFTPQPLRQAQTQAIKAVEEIIPRLVTVNMAMAEVELEVRRARKKRTKAAAAAH
ncbi:hypothetical protein V8F33_001292 [Rhypophila sp. PSN 637]